MAEWKLYDFLLKVNVRWCTSTPPKYTYAYPLVSVCLLLYFGVCTPFAENVICFKCEKCLLRNTLNRCLSLSLPFFALFWFVIFHISLFGGLYGSTSTMYSVFFSVSSVGNEFMKQWHDIYLQ